MVEVVCTRPILRGPTTPFREEWLEDNLSAKGSEYRVVVEVARVTGGEKIDVVSDSGEEDIQVHANGLSAFADLKMQITQLAGWNGFYGRSGQKPMQTRTQVR